MSKPSSTKGNGFIKGSDETLNGVISEIRDISEASEIKQSHFAALDAARFCYETRKKAGLTQTKLAENMKVSQSVIARIESGGLLKGPTLDMLQRIAEGCGMALILNTVPIALSNKSIVYTEKIADKKLKTCSVLAVDFVDKKKM